MDDAGSDSIPHDFVDFYDAALKPVDLLPGERYVELEFIAEGATKKVYRATDSHCSREVALAYIKEDVFDLSQAVDFIREVQITSSLEHPNIIRIYDIGINDGRPWFSMEYLSGKTLEEFIKENPALSLFERLEIFRQLCDAVTYAHDNDILHLDLKPSNVNIGNQNQVILCDWGISSSVSTTPEADLDKGHTLKGYVKGSPGYMAPEQASANYKKHRSADIFGLGAVLHFLLTSEAPVAGATSAEKLENTKLGSLRTFDRKEIPPRLLPILEKALAIDPSERYQYASHLSKDIEKYQSGHATAFESASTFKKFTLFISRHKVPAAIVSTLLLSLVVFTLFYIRDINKQKNRASVASQHAQEAQQKAEESKEVAEKALRDYKEGQEILKQVNNKFAATLLIENRISLRSFNFKKALKDALLSHEKKPTNQTQFRIGYTYLILGEFTKAHEYLKETTSKHFRLLKKIAEQYQNVEKLTVKQFFAIYDQVAGKYNNLPIYLVASYCNRSSPQDKVEVIIGVLARMNKIKPQKITYQQESNTLSLAGCGDVITTHTFIWPDDRTSLINLLILLKPATIIVDDTPFNRSQQFTLGLGEEVAMIYK